MPRMAEARDARRGPDATASETGQLRADRPKAGRCVGASTITILNFCWDLVRRAVQVNHWLLAYTDEPQQKSPNPVAASLLLQSLNQSDLTKQLYVTNGGGGARLEYATPISFLVFLPSGRNRAF
jgi:hypothetical protein